MKFRKSAADVDAETAADVSDVGDDTEEFDGDDTSRAGGKGRPTPKRRDVVGARGPVTAPRTRKEAYARQKRLAKEARSARASTGASMTPAQRRAAIRSGEVLQRRDQGPTRKIARDFVDSRRLFSNYLLWLFPLLVVTYLIPQAWIVQLLLVAAFLGLVVEWMLVGRQIRAIATERYGSAEGTMLSIGFYAGSRAYLPRRWRIPAPQCERGDEI